jgi:hypothetical protein
MSPLNFALEQLTGLVWVFGAAAIFLVVKVLNTRRYQIKLDFIHKERIAAMDKGIPLPELPEYDKPSQTLLSYVRLNPRWPLGAGVTLILGAIGLGLALFLSGDPYHRQIWSFSFIPFFLGFGLMLQYRLTRP